MAGMRLNSLEENRTYPSSVVLPALCHLLWVMDVSDDDLGYLIRFKEAFTAELSKQKESMSIKWLKVATVVDPRFKDLKCLPRSERDGDWLMTCVPSSVTMKQDLLLVACDLEDEGERAADTTVDQYKAEPPLWRTVRWNGGLHMQGPTQTWHFSHRNTWLHLQLLYHVRDCPRSRVILYKGKASLST